MANYYFDGGIDPANGNNAAPSCEIPAGFVCVTDGYVRVGDQYFARNAGEWVTINEPTSEPAKDFYCLIRDQRLQRVLNGIQLLDLRAKGWLDKVSLATLDMTSRCDCILGQIYGNYQTGKIELFRDRSADAFPQEISIEAANHGFTYLVPRDDADKFAETREIWAVEITRLRRERSNSGN